MTSNRVLALLALMILAVPSWAQERLWIDAKISGKRAKLRPGYTEECTLKVKGTKSREKFFVLNLPKYVDANVNFDGLVWMVVCEGQYLEGRCRWWGGDRPMEGAKTGYSMDLPSCGHQP